jgi:hypothetical protein
VQSFLKADGVSPPRLQQRGAGLRDTVARGMRITYADRGQEAKATVKTTSASMPAGQKNLPRLINYGRWRHPVFARKGVPRDKQAWVYQRPNRAGWWWQTAEGEIQATQVRLIKSAEMIAAIIAAEGQAVADQQPVAVYDMFK